VETTHVDETGSGSDHVLDYLSYLPIFSVEGNEGAGFKPVHVLFPCRILKSTRKFVIDDALWQNRSRDNFHQIATCQLAGL